MIKGSYLAWLIVMEMIYHYTSLNAFMKMLHTPTGNEPEEMRGYGGDMDWAYYLDFHASDVRAMNDKRENGLIAEIYSNMPTELKSHYNFIQRTLGAAYAISFCTQRDYVPMWRGYASNGCGICLGFCFENFESKTKDLNNCNDFYLKKCRYMSYSDMNETRDRITDKMNQISKILNRYNEKKFWRFLEQIIVEAAFCKLAYFEYEREVRAVGFSKREPYVKEGRYGITMYRPIKIPVSHLKEIVISPGAKDKKIAETKINELLRNIFCSGMGMTEIPVKVELSKFV